MFFDLFCSFFILLGINVWQCISSGGGVSSQPLGSVLTSTQCFRDSTGAETIGHCIILPQEQRYVMILYIVTILFIVYQSCTIMYMQYLNIVVLFLVSCNDYLQMIVMATRGRVAVSPFLLLLPFLLISQTLLSIYSPP